MDLAVAQNKDSNDPLVAALRGDELILYGQLIAPVKADASVRPFQEILIRFREEESRRLPPGSFFPVLEEEEGLLPYVDRWVVSRVSKWVRASLTINPDWPVPPNSIHLSAVTLTDRRFAAYTRWHLQAAALPQGTLCFEVTCDSALLHAQSLLGLMARLKPSRCAFILARCDGNDGAFELLRQLAPEFVKLSPGLVRLLNHGEVGFDKVDAINRACQAMGIRAMAEQVESDQTIAQLRKLGVEYGQDFGNRPARLLPDACRPCA